MTRRQAKASLKSSNQPLLFCHFPRIFQNFLSLFPEISNFCHFPRIFKNFCRFFQKFDFLGSKGDFRDFGMWPNRAYLGTFWSGPRPKVAGGRVAGGSKNRFCFRAPKAHKTARFGGGEWENPFQRKRTRVGCKRAPSIFGPKSWVRAHENRPFEMGCSSWPTKPRLRV